MFLQNLKFYAFKYKYYGIVFLCYFFLALILGKYLESVFLLITYGQLRYKFSKTFHEEQFKACIRLSTVYMCVGIIFVLPINISLLSTVLGGFGIGYYLFNRENRKDPKTVFIDKCRSAKLGERDTVLATMYCYEKRKPKEIWLWLCEQRQYEEIGWDSLYVVLNRIAKKLK